jgi:glycine/D-amino acid oxidase-like deaminating enzyme
MTIPGQILATINTAGCSGHGFGAGPGLEHLAADLITGDAPSVDPTPFRLSRFHDRSKIDVGAI